MFEILKKWFKAAHAEEETAGKRRVYVIAHTHGTVSGWLVPFQTERNYVVNNHADHLRHLSQSDLYAFAVSEVPNLIALRQLRPDSFELLRRQIELGRAELVNGFFLEPTINLTTGETLIRMGIEGLRWQREVLGGEPSFAWMIDVVGVHSQMPAIVHHLGIETLVYSRNCPGSTLHWWKSPSGARVLAVALGRDCYINWRLLFSATDPFGELHVKHVCKSLENHLSHSPDGMPVLWLVAGGDYGTAPFRADQFENLAAQWKRLYPDIELVFDKTPTSFIKEVKSALVVHEIPEVQGDNLFSYNAFWVNNPRMKQEFRMAEMRLLAAEAAAALSDAIGARPYPMLALQDAWHLLFLNSDRGLLWGIGSGEAFYSESSWNADDRFSTIDTLLDGIGTEESSEAKILSVFSMHAAPPHGFSRLQIPQGKKIAGATHDAWGMEEGITTSLPQGIGFFNIELKDGQTGKGDLIDLPTEIITRHYQVRICPKSGDILMLSLLGRHPIAVLSDSANRIRFEMQPGVELKEDFLAPREEREEIKLLEPSPGRIICHKDDISIVVESVNAISGGGSIRRRLRFFKDHPVIDADVELNDVPENLLVSLDFPLATAITREARAVPYGFAERDPRTPNLPPDIFLMADHVMHGTNARAVPAIGWSWHGNASGLGLAVLDCGIPGRESHGRTASLLLMNTSAAFRKKPNRWLSGEGRHHFRYSLFPTGNGWRDAHIPHHAAMLNNPLHISSQAGATGPLIRTSKNLSVQSIRRQVDILELRCVECFGFAGRGVVSIAVEHLSASRGTAHKIVAQMSGDAGEPGFVDYSLDLAPQEIVTMRFKLAHEVAHPPLLMQWEHLVPETKRADLSAYDPDLKGHPPE